MQLTCYVAAGKVEATPMRALTENVSRTGVLMRWMEGAPLPKVDGKLTLDLQLPENSEFGARVMRCRAEVVRVTQRAGKEHEVALRIVSMRFMKSKHGPKARDMAAVRDLAAMPLATPRII